MTKQWEPLTDYQWAAISPFFDLDRKRRHDLRQIMDCILWLLRTGAQWRNRLPAGLPWQTVYYYFDRWKKAGLFEQMNTALNQLDRQQQGREPTPSVLCIDSQSVKLAPLRGEFRGLDAHKCVNGRKRTLVVDTQGRLWAVSVRAADEADGMLGADLVPHIGKQCGPRVEKVVGDRAYNGVFAEAARRLGLAYEQASRPESARGFVPIAKRWVVERSIAWTNFFRRLVKDYEYTLSSSVSWLYLANTQIMLQRMQTYSQI